MGAGVFRCLYSMKTWKAVFFCSFFIGPLFGQATYQELRHWHQASLSIDNPIEKSKALSERLWTALQEQLEKGNSLVADSLPSISQVELKAVGKVVYTWLTRHQNSFQTWGLIYDKKSLETWELHPNESAVLGEPSQIKKLLSGGHWPGVLMYEAVPFKRKGQTMYLTIGFFPGADNVSYKHLDILSFDKAGAPIFGGRYMLWEGQKIGRKTFRYSAQASMMLKTEKGGKRVVMDHLAPASPELKNQFAFYGPDLSYDALEFNGEEWILIADVDVKNPGQDLGQPGQIQRFGPQIKPRRQP